MAHGIATAHLRHARMSPRKLRLVADTLRGLPLERALVALSFSPKKKAGGFLGKLLHSAQANARENHHLRQDTLVIEAITVDGGPIAHRWMPRAFGRATPIRKRTAHVTVVLRGEIDEKKSKNQKSDS